MQEARASGKGAGRQTVEMVKSARHRRIRRHAACNSSDVSTRLNRCAPTGVSSLCPLAEGRT